MHTASVDLEQGAGLLHRLTSYSPERDWDRPVDDPRVRQDLVANDPALLPPPVKGYDATLPTVRLPRDLPPGDSAGSALSGVGGAARALDATQLGRLLFLCSGVVRTSVHRSGPVLFRAAGSAGGRFPLEVYASTKGVAGLPDGVHWYDPVEHVLVQVGPAAGGDATTVVVTGVPWRTGWRYAERGWRHQYWDAGTLLSQLLAAAVSVGLDPLLRSDFPDAAVRELVGADGVHEQPLALVTFGPGTPAIEAGGPAARGSLAEVELPLCTSAQRAGDRAVLADPWPGAAPLDVPPDGIAGRGRPAPRLAAPHGRHGVAAPRAAGVGHGCGGARHRRPPLGGGARRRRRRARGLPVAPDADPAAHRRPAGRADAPRPRSGSGR